MSEMLLCPRTGLCVCARIAMGNYIIHRVQRAIETSAQVLLESQNNEKGLFDVWLCVRALSLCSVNHQRGSGEAGESKSCWYCEKCIRTSIQVVAKVTLNIAVIT